MTRLTIFDEQNPTAPLFTSKDPEAIADELTGAGVRFERWDAGQPVQAGDPQEKVLAAYRDDIDRLIRDGGYQTVDVVSMAPDNPNRAEARKKFLDEHTHGEDEVRFFVDGRGLFTLHIGERIYEILCETGDLLGVPAGTPHWFDMGPEPRFVAIRLFNNPEGWVAHFTGSDIASRFPRLES